MEAKKLNAVQNAVNSKMADVAVEAVRWTRDALAKSCLPGAMKVVILT